MNWTSIKRHNLVKGKASPDNPALRDYWRKRQTAKIQVLSTSKIRIELWSRQKGLCPVCRQILDSGEPIVCHDITRSLTCDRKGLDKWLLAHQSCRNRLKNKQVALEVSKLLEPNAG